MKILKLILLLLLLGARSSHGEELLYKTVLMRAAPGKLLNLIELLQEDMANHKSYGIDKPYLMRHSQGDQWDLLMIIPTNGLEQYYSPANLAKREKSNSLDKHFGDPFYDFISFHEEFFVAGPSLAKFRSAFESFNFYHVEMFVALAGRQKALLKQRQMENIYLEEINRNENLIFTKITGSRWDCFTIGCYRDIKHFAESADIPAELEERAAQKAGFKSAGTIGSYMREFIMEHHDTLAGAVR